MDGKENTTFANTGTEQPVEAGRPDDVVIKVDEPSGNKGWKIATICALVAVLALGAGLALTLMGLTSADDKASKTQADLNARMAELAKFKEMTGEDNPEDVVPGGGIELVLTDFGLDESAVIFQQGSRLLVTEDKKYQIAILSLDDVRDGALVGSEYHAYVYRSLPDGMWVNSGFTGHGTPECSEVTDEEVKIFVDGGYWHRDWECGEVAEDAE